MVNRHGKEDTKHGGKCTVSTLSNIPYLSLDAITIVSAPHGAVVSCKGNRTAKYTDRRHEDRDYDICTVLIFDEPF